MKHASIFFVASESIFMINHKGTQYLPIWLMARLKKTKHISFPMWGLLKYGEISKFALSMRKIIDFKNDKP